MKKTIKKRAFISAIAMLIVSAIVLTSSTFAWFSMSKEAEVSSMNLNITTADGISISANTHKFGTTVTLDDIIPAADAAGKGLAADADHTNNIPDLLAPVSSEFYIGSGYPVFYKGSIGEDQKVSVTRLDNDYSGQLVVFDLFVQVSQNNTQVKLTGSSVACDDENVVKAMRVGFVNCGCKEYAEKDAAKTIKTTQKTNTAIWIVDGNASDNTKYISGSAGAGLSINKVSDAPIASLYTESTSAGNVAKSATASDFSFIAQKGVNRVRFYVWVEGNDADCTNDIAGSSFDFTLKLSID